MTATFLRQKIASGTPSAMLRYQPIRNFDGPNIAYLRIVPLRSFRNIRELKPLPPKVLAHQRLRNCWRLPRSYDHASSSSLFQVATYLLSHLRPCNWLFCSLFDPPPYPGADSKLFIHPHVSVSINYTLVEKFRLAGRIERERSCLSVLGVSLTCPCVDSPFLTSLLNRDKIATQKPLQWWV